MLADPRIAVSCCVPCLSSPAEVQNQCDQELEFAKAGHCQECSVIQGSGENERLSVSVLRQKNF